MQLIYFLKQIFGLIFLWQCVLGQNDLYGNYVEIAKVKLIALMGSVHDKVRKLFNESGKGIRG